MSELFPSSDFDDWAASYDESVISESSFPFDGYSRVLQTIFELAAPEPDESVLDLGTGTGNLAALFSQHGCPIWGLDFSAKMLALAQVKMPQAVFARVDLRAEWPAAFQRQYAIIVSAYTFHHFTLPEKIGLIRQLLTRHLTRRGRLLIGDIAFANAAQEDDLRINLGSEWEQEYYWLADETISACAAAGIAAEFIKISTCAGIFRFAAQL